jgi:AcrR family transcriptional regulator
MKNFVPPPNLPARPRKGSRAQQKAERPDQILDAAFDEFVLKGYAETRIENVAARIGMTKGAVYFYFESKEVLFERTVQVLGSTYLAQFMESAAPWTDDIEQDLRRYLGAIYRFMSTIPRLAQLLRLVLAEAPRFPELVDAFFRMSLDPIVLRLDARLQEAIEKKQIRNYPPHLVDLIVAPPFTYYVMAGLFSHREGIRNWDSEQLLNAQMDLLLNGLIPKKSDASEPR